MWGENIGELETKVINGKIILLVQSEKKLQPIKFFLGLLFMVYN